MKNVAIVTIAELGILQNFIAVLMKRCRFPPSPFSSMIYRRLEIAPSNIRNNPLLTIHEGRPSGYYHLITLRMTLLQLKLESG